MSPCGVSFVGTLDHTPPCRTSSRGCPPRGSPPTSPTLREIRKGGCKFNGISYGEVQCDCVRGV